MRLAGKDGAGRDVGSLRREYLPQNEAGTFWARTGRGGGGVIRLVRRPSPSRFWAAATPVLAVVLTMIAGGLLFAALGKDPLEAIRTIFWDPLFGKNAFYYRTQLPVKAAPLILIATGLALGFRAGIWNIGAEGQYIIGALSGAAVALALHPMEGRWLFVVCILAGALGGMLWALIPAFLKVRFGTSEILVSLMLVYVAENLLASMALGAMKNPEGRGFPGSRNLSQYPAVANGELFRGTGIHWGVIAALVAVALAWLILSRHMLGFRIRVAGMAPRAARFAGVEPGRLVLVCMGISGALAGLAGWFELAGPSGIVSIDFNVGYGFTAIIVAFLGRLHPFGILLAGLLMALTYIGGDIARSSLGLPSAAIQAFQGMLLFFLLALDVLANYRVRLGRAAAA
jgi:general nucleoside transport system permease protein